MFDQNCRKRLQIFIASNRYIMKVYLVKNLMKVSSMLVLYCINLVNLKYFNTLKKLK